MIIQCPNCRKKYKYDNVRFQGEEKKRIKCPHCAMVFDVRKPDAEMKNCDDTTAIHQTQVAVDMLERVAREMLRRNRISLAFLSGSLAGRVYEIRSSPVIIGRSDCDVVLDDPECSRRHAEISIRADGVYLKDLNSTNGTYVEGIRTNEIKLNNKDEFSIGSISIMLISRDRESETQ